jgi:hypothetical protein
MALGPGPEKSAYGTFDDDRHLSSIEVAWARIDDLTAERDAARDGAKTYKLMLDEAEAREQAVKNVLAVVLRSLKDIVTSVPDLGKG